MIKYLLVLTFITISTSAQAESKKMTKSIDLNKVDIIRLKDGSYFTAEEILFDDVKIIATKVIGTKLYIDRKNIKLPIKAIEMKPPFRGTVTAARVGGDMGGG